MPKCDYFDTCNQNTGSTFCETAYKSCSIFRQKQSIDNGETALGIGAVQLEDIEGISKDKPSDIGGY